MLRVNKLTDYATVILCHMALNFNKIYSAYEIANQLSIAQPTASKILKHLAAAHLVLSHRGASGGYQLNLPPDEISLSRVIIAMEGNVAMTECSLKQGLCEQETCCSVRQNWQKISFAILKALEGISIAELSRPNLHIPTINGVLHDNRHEV